MHEPGSPRTHEKILLRFAGEKKPSLFNNPYGTPSSFNESQFSHKGSRFSKAAAGLESVPWLYCKHNDGVSNWSYHFGYLGDSCATLFSLLTIFAYFEVEWKTKSVVVPRQSFANVIILLLNHGYLRIHKVHFSYQNS